MSQLVVSGNTSIYLGDLIQTNFNQFILDNYSLNKIVILTDENVSSFWIEYLVTQFDCLSRAEIIEMPAGEENKTIDICLNIWEALSEYKINRNDLIINFGGGVITDLGGFIASTYKRGISFINIPTTLLSQVDASVGGKTGIDFMNLKNQLGTFASPIAVYIHPNFLQTLPKEQILSGFAEMLKHGLISNQVYWNQLKKISFDAEINWIELIKESIEIKNHFVTIDFDEKNERKKLNFGHTIGHAIESYGLVNSNPILHGHAVALGMIAESFISMKLGLLTIESFEEINHVINSFFAKLDAIDSNALIELMRNDKKNVDDKISFTLLENIGSALINKHVSDHVLHEALSVILK